jgi:hypothetical protein
LTPEPPKISNALPIVKSTQLLHKLQILNRSTSASIRDGNGAPFGKLGNKLMVNTALQALDICGVDEKLRAMRFQKGYRVCAVLIWKRYDEYACHTLI